MIAEIHPYVVRTRDHLMSFDYTDHRTELALGLEIEAMTGKTVRIGGKRFDLPADAKAPSCSFPVAPTIDEMGSYAYPASRTIR